MSRLRNTFLGLILLLNSAACAQSRIELQPTEFDLAIKQTNVQVLDVRTADEFQSGHIPGAMQANSLNKEEFYSRIKSIDKTKPTYVYCLSGARSTSAAERMAEIGFTDLHVLAGGINAWKKEGLSIEGKSITKEVTEEEYKSEASSAAIVLIDFGATWCPPCRKMEPVLEKLLNEHGHKFKLVKVDGGINTSLMKAQSVSELPTFIVYKQGKEVSRHTGLMAEDDLIKALF